MASGGEMIAPILVHLGQLLKLRLKIIHGIAGIFLGGGIKFHILRRLGKIHHLGRVALVVLGDFCEAFSKLVCAVAPSRRRLARK